MMYEKEHQQQQQQYRSKHYYYCEYVYNKEMHSSSILAGLLKQQAPTCIYIVE